MENESQTIGTTADCESERAIDAADGLQRGLRSVHFCLHCGKPFTPKRKPNKTNPYRYCSRSCLGHAPKHRAFYSVPASTLADRVRASGLVNMRLRRDTIERPPICQYCAKPCKPDAHHPDYSRPPMPETKTSNLNAALAYCQLGLRIFPCWHATPNGCGCGRGVRENLKWRAEQDGNSEDLNA